MIESRLRVLSVVVASAAALVVALGPASTDGAAQARPAVKNPILVLDTVRGMIEIELFRQDAPKSVEYIVNLVNRHYYRGLRFHRAERTLVQVGDPNSRNVTRRNIWGQTSATPTIGVFEPSKRHSHTRGAVGLAHSGVPESAASQFYIMKTASPSLDGKYTIIGRVTSGMAVVDAIRFEDVLKLATIREPQ